MNDEFDELDEMEETEETAEAEETENAEGAEVTEETAQAAEEISETGDETKETVGYSSTYWQHQAARDLANGNMTAYKNDMKNASKAYVKEQTKN